MQKKILVFLTFAFILCLVIYLKFPLFGNTVYLGDMNNEKAIYVHPGNIIIIQRVHKVLAKLDAPINNIHLSNKNILRPISGVTQSSDEALSFTPDKGNPVFRVISLGSVDINATAACPSPLTCAWLPAYFFKIIATK